MVGALKTEYFADSSGMRFKSIKKSLIFGKSLLRESDIFGFSTLQTLQLGEEKYANIA